MNTWRLKRKLYRDVKLKSGEVLKKGTPIFVAPTNDDTICLASFGTTDYKFRWSTVIRPPSIETLMEQEMDGVCDSIRGCRVEPDGHDDHGYPSWLLALGVI